MLVGKWLEAGIWLTFVVDCNSRIYTHTVLNYWIRDKWPQNLQTATQEMGSGCCMYLHITWFNDIFNKQWLLWDQTTTILLYLLLKLSVNLKKWRENSFVVYTFNEFRGWLLVVYLTKWQMYVSSFRDYTLTNSNSCW